MLAQNWNTGNSPQQEPREIHQLQRCAHCHAPIYWMRQRVTGKWAAIDTNFTHGGDVLINLTAGTYEQLSPDERVTHIGWLHALHRNICPQVDQQGMW